jgi:probable rRNA maturation factor
VLSVSLVGSDEMSELNSKFRGKPGVSNVLSFPQSERGTSGPNPDLLGDVVICTDRAAEEALELGYTNDEMTVYLLIHGILHLVGYLHDKPEDQHSMQAKVDEIFGRLYPSGP